MELCQVQECPILATRVALQAKLFKGLADPTRLRILLALEEGPLRVVDLVNKVGRAQPNVSAHLACLVECGLVAGTAQGRETYYSHTDIGGQDLLQIADRMVRKIGPQLCTCEWAKSDPI